MTTYYTTLTNAALAKISAALAAGTTLTMSEMAVGDGNGTTPNPTPNSTGLVREVYRAPVNQLAVNQDGYLVAEMIIPMDEGGFTIREIALFDDDGALFAIGNMPTIDKPEVTDNSVGELVLRMIVSIDHAETINLTIDSTLVTATQAWVEANFAPGATFPGGTIGQVLAKKSNLDGDTEWRDPTSVNIVVDAREQEVVLTASQTAVTLTTVTTTGLVLYIDGIRLPKSRWTATNATTVTLDRSYPAGTVLTMVQNAPAAQIEAIRVGQIIMLGLTSTPQQIFGYGTWQRVAEGRAIFGLNSADADFNTLGKTGGEKTHTHAGSTNSAGSHNHQGATGAGGDHNHGGSSGSAGAHSHSTTNAGSHSHSGSTAGHTLTTDQIPAHNHSVQLAVYTGGGSGSTGLDRNQTYQGMEAINTGNTGGGQSHAHGIGADGDHSHSVTEAPNHAHSIPSSGTHAHAVATDGTHTHLVSVTNVSHLPPYFTVAMWQRTA